MKYFISAAFSLCCFFSFSSAIATPDDQYRRLIPAIDPTVSIHECPTVQELRAEFRGNLITKAPEFKGLAISVKNPHIGFNFNDINAIGMNAYKLIADYSVPNTNKKGKLYMIVADGPEAGSFSSGFVLFNVLQALSNGSLYKIEPSRSDKLVDKACSYQVSFPNSSKKYILHARP